MIIVLDSLRHDVAVEAEMKNAARLGPIELRHSYATWTAPSHTAFAMGLLPYRALRYRQAATEYQENYQLYRDRLGVETFEVADLLPDLNLAEVLRSRHGYRTEAYVSMPVLNPSTSFNRGFDHYELRSRHNDLADLVAELDWSGPQRRFVFINSGITHYPYAVPGGDTSGMPHVSGVHGVLKRSGAAPVDGAAPPFPSRSELASYRRRQVRAAAHADDCLGTLFASVPRDTWIIVTSDHGELFGEDGHFGHGPMAHPALLRVPFTEGIAP